VLLAVLVAGTLAGIWFIRANLMGSEYRVSLVMRGAGAAVAGGAVAVEASPGLAASGVQIETLSVTREAGQMLFVLTERTRCLLLVSAGKEPLKVTQLGYVLFDAGGEVLGQGRLQPDVQIEPDTTVSAEIIDARISDATRIEVRKLP
jgi:hypothetical protein